MKAIGKIIGTILWFGSGAVLFVFWFIAMTKWMGFWGGVLAIVLSPGLVIFPIVFWIVEKVFPFFYFILWGLAWVGLLIKAASSD
jgi:hypothetical protein